MEEKYILTPPFLLMMDLSIKNINLSDSVTTGEEFFHSQLQIFWLESLENTASKIAILWTKTS